MKVMCINNVGWVEDKCTWYGKKYKRDCHGPAFGDFVTVISGYWEEGKYYYLLLEWPTKIDAGWQADCFVVCSEIDETEMVIEKEVQCS